MNGETNQVNSWPDPSELKKKKKKIPYLSYLKPSSRRATPQITKAFRDFYAELYNVEGGLTTLSQSDKRKRLLSNLKAANPPKLSRSALKEIEADFTTEEF